MRAAAGLLGLVLVVAIVYFVYTNQFGGNKGELPPKQRIDIAAVRSDLLSLAQAERRYIATTGTCATLEQLRQEGGVQFQGSGRRGYEYVIEPEAGLHFRITAKPADPTRTDWPTLTIDDNLQISSTEPQEPK